MGLNCDLHRLGHEHNNICQNGSNGSQRLNTGLQHHHVAENYFVVATVIKLVPCAQPMKVQSKQQLMTDGKPQLRREWPPYWYWFDNLSLWTSLPQGRKQNKKQRRKSTQQAQMAIKANCLTVHTQLASKTRKPWKTLYEIPWRPTFYTILNTISWAITHHLYDPF